MIFKTSEKLPPQRQNVLIFHDGEWKLGVLLTEYPHWEDPYPKYSYWDDPINDGQEYEWFDVTHWTELPADPEPLTDEELEQWRTSYTKVLPFLMEHLSL